MDRVADINCCIFLMSNAFGLSGNHHNRLKNATAHGTMGLAMKMKRNVNRDFGGKIYFI